MANSKYHTPIAKSAQKTNSVGYTLLELLTAKQQAIRNQHSGYTLLELLTVKQQAIRNQHSGYTLLELLTVKQQAIRNQHSGYTLLELLIVVSIMIIVFMVGFTSYRDYQRRQELESSIRQVSSDLRLAQEYAISGKKPDSSPDNVCETSTLIGYAFIRIDNTSYRIDANCGGGSYTVRGPITLPSGIQLTSISGTPTDTIVFHVLARGVDRNGNTTVTIRSNATGATDQIIVTPSGEIK